MVFIKPKAAIQAQKHPHNESQALRSPSGKSSSKGVSCLVLLLDGRVSSKFSGLLFVEIVELSFAIVNEGRDASGEVRLNILMMSGVMVVE